MNEMNKKLIAILCLFIFVFAVFSFLESRTYMKFREDYFMRNNNRKIWTSDGNIYDKVVKPLSYDIDEEHKVIYSGQYFTDWFIADGQSRRGEIYTEIAPACSWGTSNNYREIDIPTDYGVLKVSLDFGTAFGGSILLDVEENNFGKPLLLYVRYDIEYEVVEVYKNYTNGEYKPKLVRTYIRESDRAVEFDLRVVE